MAANEFISDRAQRSGFWAWIFAGCFWLTLIDSASAAAPARKPAEPISAAASEYFEKEVRPLLAERCIQCHGAQKKVEAALKLTSRADMLHGGDDGPAIVPGRPNDSLLIKAIRYEGEIQMPPKGKLQDSQIQTLTRWVEMGAPWSQDAPPTSAPSGQPFKITDEQRRFWAFQPVRPVAAPVVMDRAAARSEIDRFILAPLEAKGLSFAPPADKRTLLRRATFDLTGLPPTPDEVAAFLADDSPDAFSRVVERLLASPAYGERWGRHWLDLVRYTDSLDARVVGEPTDITDAWRYRDWVVDAINRDLPYDQFIIQQLAGDLLPVKEKSQVNVEGIIATGMLAIGEWGAGDADKEKLMTDIVDDQINVVGRTMLGLTLGCARCHDHKFDPIPTADYYGLAGIFFSSHVIADPGKKSDGTTPMHIPLVSAAEVEKHEQLMRPIKDLEARVKAAPPAQQAELLAALKKLKEALVPAPPTAVGIQDGGVPTSQYAGTHDTRIYARGAYTHPGEVVPRHFPIIVAGEKQPPIANGSGRLDLARWIVNPNNPLTARVMVNRIWQHHFGQGIVRTPSNFGKLGEPPTHPELLDYLAAKFIESGWSLKAMHRAIMLSAVYQQSWNASAASLQADPDNRLFGRMNRRRLEAEAIRDSLLAVTGELDRRQGGPATRDFDSPRRTLYQMTIRSDRSTYRELFDAADSSAIIDTRTISTVAPQALFLMNHPFVIHRAAALARRINDSGLADTVAKINRLYLLLYGRPPNAEELEIGRRSADGGWDAYCQILLCANEFVYVE